MGKPIGCDIILDQFRNDTLTRHKIGQPEMGYLYDHFANPKGKRRYPVDQNHGNSHDSRLQGGGARLHIDYINLLYRILHDLSESPRAAFGGTERDLSGVALEIELQPLLQKVRRKRIIRTAAYNRRNRLILRLLEKYCNEDFGDHQLRVVWGPILPQDLSKLVGNEQVLVQNGIHSRCRAMDEMGVNDPEMEFGRWLEERKAILSMNKELHAGTGGNGARVRVNGSRSDTIEHTP